MALTLAPERSPALDAAVFVDVDAGLDTASAACATGNGELARLFFSEEVGDIARAKELCSACPMMLDCLEGAVARSEPAGVWGGQLFASGRIVTGKRRPGRPSAVVRPGDLVPDLPVPVHLRGYLRSA